MLFTNDSQMVGGGDCVDFVQGGEVTALGLGAWSAEMVVILPLPELK